MMRRNLLLATTVFAGLASTTVEAQEAATKNATLDYSKIGHVVVIYGENRSFDHEYGYFPGANGLQNLPAAKYQQLDRDGSTVMTTLPPTWGGVLDTHVLKVNGGYAAAQISQTVTTTMPAKPFSINDPVNGLGLDMNVATRDLYHRFYENQMQIHGGKNDWFAAWADGGGITMGNYHYASQFSQVKNEPLWYLAANFVLADNFYQSAFGGSYLNHQFLICSCTPTLTAAQQSRAKQRSTGTLTVPVTSLVTNPPADASAFTTSTPPGGGTNYMLTPANSITTTNSAYVAGTSVLKTAATVAPSYVASTNLTPQMSDGLYYTINTMQPPYPPSGNQMTLGSANSTTFWSTGAIAASSNVDPDAATTTPPSNQQTIGDLLSAANVNWAWYAGAMQWAIDNGSYTTVNGSFQNVNGSYGFTVNSTRDARANLVPNFQAHHNPFNYYANFAPGTAARAAHLKDGGMNGANLLADIDAGNLPPVTFYKPQGNLNTHTGYTDITTGDAHIYNVVQHLMKGPQWNDMVIVITYDENGGWWDHAAPPKGDMFGPGTRIPAIIVSPFAKKGTVDHTQYDTTSILRLITNRWNLPVLAGISRRDTALVNNGGVVMGDLSAALNLPRLPVP